MSTIQSEIWRGAYYDSVVLMQLQRELVGLPGVLDAGVVMGTDANKDILVQSDLLTPEAQAAGADDLIIVVKAENEDAAREALAQVDALLTQRQSSTAQEGYRPKSVESAAEMLPDAQWALVSVAGQYAAGVARKGLELGKHIFLFSDNVSLEDEVSLKQAAREKGLLVMGPDCGTAIVNGVGLGFANRVRRGAIGVIAASGTGLQQVTARIHQLGAGVTHGLGTGGRDLKEEVGAITALQALDLFRRDPETKVIVIISKPPADRVARSLLRAAKATGKPVVVDFIGFEPDKPVDGNLHFARTLDEAAELAASLLNDLPEEPLATEENPFAAGQKYLRGLFSGGTLAYEALLILRDMLPNLYANLHLDGVADLTNPMQSQGNTIVDLGEDVFTVGRLHPMMDNDLRIRRLHQEAADPETALILLDVVLGYGSHPDPAGELAPAIEEARKEAQAQGRHLEFVAVVVGTDEDPQDMAAQIETLEAAGVQVFTSNQEGVAYAGQRVQALNPLTEGQPVTLESLTGPLSAINVGLEIFAESLKDQGAEVVWVDWRPPAGGNERLAAILARMRGGNL
ncbi:MAG TPA: acyl-CoA synthetase FdrA [Caldilineae bacterium]|nr:acyl-CoA synthetase FdrA [Caldilineae bacterium]